MRKLGRINADINRDAWYSNHTAGSTTMSMPLLDWPGKITGMSSKEEALHVMGPMLAKYEESITPDMEAMHKTFLEKIFVFNDTNENGQPIVTDVNYLPSGSRPRSVYDLNQVAVYADVVFEAYDGIANLRQQLLNASTPHRGLWFRIWVCGRYKNQTMYEQFSRKENPYMGKTMDEILKMLEGTWSWDDIKVEDVHMGMKWGQHSYINPPATVLPVFKTDKYNYGLKEIHIEIKNSGDMRSFVEKALESDEVSKKMHTRKAQDNNKWGHNNDKSLIYYKFFNQVMRLATKVQGAKNPEDHQKYVDELEATFNEWEAQAQ